MASDIDPVIEEALKGPRRVRGDQGEVEQRSADELIKASEYLRSKTLDRHTVLQNSIVRGTKYGPCAR
jgi:hypothetical protein